MPQFYNQYTTIILLFFYHSTTVKYATSKNIYFYYSTIILLLYLLDTIGMFWVCWVRPNNPKSYIGKFLPILSFCGCSRSCLRVVEEAFLAVRDLRGHAQLQQTYKMRMRSACQVASMCKLDCKILNIGASWKMRLSGAEISN